MSCSCGNSLNPFNRIMDLDVVYTGNGGECNDKKIYEGMRLREVLDILVSNCANGESQRGSALFTGNGVPSGIEAVAGDVYFDMSDGSIYQFGTSWVDTEYSIAGGGEAVWGSITGSVEDQADLVAYILANGFGEDRVGTNLHLGEDGKLNLGTNSLPDYSEIYNVVGISPDGTSFTLEDLQNWSKGLAFLTSKDDPLVGSTYFGVPGEIYTRFDTFNINSNRMVIEPKDGGTTFLDASADLFNVYTNSLNLRGDSIQIGHKSGTRTFINISSNLFLLVNPINGSRTRIIAPSPASGTPSQGASIDLEDGNVNIKTNNSLNSIFLGITGGNSARNIGLKTIDQQIGSQWECCFELQGWDGGSQPSNYIHPFFRYRDGMPRSTQITDNVIPTIGYIRDTLIATAVSAAVTPLQNQIDALEARIAALEAQ